MSDEVLSGLKILVALAKADGVVHDNERLAIENALDGIDLPEHATVDSLLATNVDLDAELAIIKSPSIKQQTFDSACALVYVDGEASEVERVMLERVRAAFELGDQTAASVRFKQALDRAFAPLAESEGSSERGGALDDEIRRFSALNAALSSFALPSFCAGINLSNEVRLARKVGTFFGHRGDSNFWRTFVGNIVGAASSWLAVSSLAKMAGLAAGSRTANAYASTYALGKTTKLYFEKNESLAPEALRLAFKEAKREGLTTAKDEQTKIDAKRAEVETTKRVLDTDLLNDTISETDYEHRLSTLD